MYSALCRSTKFVKYQLNQAFSSLQAGEAKKESKGATDCSDDVAKFVQEDLVSLLRQGGAEVDHERGGQPVARLTRLSICT